MVREDLGESVVSSRPGPAADVRYEALTRESASHLSRVIPGFKTSDRGQPLLYRYISTCSARRRSDARRRGLRGAAAGGGLRPARAGEGSYQVEIEHDDDCLFSVREIIDQSTPARQAAVSTDDDGLLARLARKVLDAVAPRLSAASGPKRVTNYVWSYGYGGKWDMLSEVRGSVDFTWTDTSAWMNAVFRERPTTVQRYLAAQDVPGRTSARRSAYRAPGPRGLPWKIIRTAGEFEARFATEEACRA